MGGSKPWGGADTRGRSTSAGRFESSPLTGRNSEADYDAAPADDDFDEIPSKPKTGFGGGPAKLRNPYASDFADDDDDSVGGASTRGRGVRSGGRGFSSGGRRGRKRDDDGEGW